MVLRRRHQPRSQLRLRPVGGEGDAVDGADVHTGITLDAQAVGEDGLDIAVQAALGFGESELVVEAEFDLGLDVLQRDLLSRCGTLKRRSSEMPLS